MSIEHSSGGHFLVPSIQTPFIFLIEISKNIYINYSKPRIKPWFDWFGSVSVLAKNRLQRIVRTAEKLTGQKQLSVSELAVGCQGQEAGREDRL